MKRSLFPTLGIIVLFITSLAILQVSCISKAESNTPELPEKKEPSHAELVSRGQYLVMIGSCNDCHSPKNFGPAGFTFDSTRLLSGHPAGSPLPKVDIKALQPGYWLLFGPDLTSAVGPWGVTFSANLTPDSATGIGAWSEETFVKALRTGKHLGQENGRPIMPPMPWELVGKMTDEDLKAVYTFLQELPAISNRVPAPIPPNEVSSMRK
jgi:hypothetical protein